MGVKERRQRERSELRRKILAAARELFVEKGYEAVTMRQIAARIEYSATAIYLHFRDKKAVMDALCDQDFLALARRFRKIAAVADPIERLRQAGQAYSAFALAHPNHYRLMFMTPHPPHLPEESAIEQGNPDQDAYAFLEWTATQAIASGRLRPELDDPQLVSQLMWSGIHGVVSLLIVKGSEPWIDWRPQRELAAAMCELTIRGLLADPERASQD
jgi:AcrR family transcriptional regulator